jgi:exosortase A
MLATTTKIDSPDILKICAATAAVLAAVMIYFATVRSIVGIWNSSDTFAHGYIILPISLWLIWKRRNSLPIGAAAPYWPALALIAACGFGWLLADLAAVQVVQQYAFVAMIPVMVLAVLGPTVSRAMAFPLLFLLLAVPFGDAFIDPLIEFTADFTVAAVQLTGIPVLRNGTHFELPTGNWSVVEACSGVRYLISSITLGSLYAYLTYRSRVRQAVFVLLSIIVPIVANGLRAYMIVMIGHYSGMTLAVGVDHLVYGWLFFGIVMFLMFGIGSLWREDRDEPGLSPMQSAATWPDRTMSGKHFFGAALACAACAAIWPAYAHYIDRTGQDAALPALSSFTGTWKKTDAFTQWKPRFSNPSTALYGYYEQESQKVGLAVLYYRDSGDDAKLISSINRLLDEKDAVFRQIAGGTREENIGGKSMTLREAAIDSASGRMLVWHWYWIDGTSTASNYAGKLIQAKAKLLMRGNDGAAVMVFAPYESTPEEARSTLRRYLAANLPTIEATLATPSDQITASVK